VSGGTATSNPLTTAVFGLLPTSRSDVCRGFSLVQSPCSCLLDPIQQNYSHLITAGPQLQAFAPTLSCRYVAIIFPPHATTGKIPRFVSPTVLTCHPAGKFMIVICFAFSPQVLWLVLKVPTPTQSPVNRLGPLEPELTPLPTPRIGLIVHFLIQENFEKEVRRLWTSTSPS
jgi:hypothetical protein